MLRIREGNDEKENPQNTLFVSVFKIMSFSVVKLKLQNRVVNELN